MLLAQQNFMLAALLALSSSIVMHQSSYTVYNNHDIFRRGTLRQILWLLMGICINAEAGFLIWYAYMTGILHALKLIFLSQILVLPLRVFERWLGLYQRAWLTCIAGIAIVPALLIALIWIVLPDFQLIYDL